MLKKKLPVCYMESMSIILEKYTGKGLLEEISEDY